MNTPYGVIAPIYDRIGLSSYGELLTPKLLLMAQSSLDWIGRRVVDLGCGTGAGARFLAQRGLNVTGIDTEPKMLAQARMSTSELSGVQWVEGDARTLADALAPNERVDMIMGLGIVSELSGLRELEMLFLAALQALHPGRMLIFDLDTIEGLASEIGPRFLHEDPHLVIFSQTGFDFERQTLSQQMNIFASDQAEETPRDWQRANIEFVRRSYPVQAVAALLARCGFTVISIMSSDNADLLPYNPTGHTGRVVFFCIKGSAQS